MYNAKAYYHKVKPLPVNQVAVGATPVSCRVAAVLSDESLLIFAERASITKSRFELDDDAVVESPSAEQATSPIRAIKSTERFMLVFRRSGYLQQ